MGRRFSTIQTNFSSGELDPKLIGRRDLQKYFAGGQQIRNAVVAPQGGVFRRWGTVYRDKVRKTLLLEDLSAATLTTPNGGTAANAHDGDRATDVLTTTAIGVINPYVVFHIDLGSAKTVLFMEAQDMSLSLGTSTEFVLQYSTDDVAWNTIGATLDTISVDAISRRRRVGTDGISARYWRLARVGATDLTTAVFAVSEIKLFIEDATYGNRRRFDFEDATQNLFALVATDRNIAVYDNTGTLVADVGIPHTSAQLPEISVTQSRDSMLIWHDDVPPHLIQRQGADAQWDELIIAFDNLPVFNFRGDIITSPTLTLTATSGRGVTCTASSGIFTASMVGWGIRNVDQAGSARITGFTSDTVVTVDVLETFTDTGVEGWNLLEVAWSATRGWPRCGLFFNGRLWVGGAKELTNWVWASVVGLFFDFDHLDPGLDDNGIAFPLDHKDVVHVYGFYGGRHLQIFTSRAEFYVLPEDDVITPLTVDVRPATAVGSKGPGLQFVGVEAGTMFVQRGGRAVRELTFTDLNNPYEATNLNLLNTTVVNNPVAIALRKSTSSDEGDIYFVINADGTAGVLQTLRSQEILAWSGISIDGSIKDIGVLLDDVYIIAERTIGGATVEWLERLDITALLDASTVITSGLPATSASGLDHQEGETVRIYADGNLIDDQVVTGGAVDFELNGESFTATTRVEIGKAWPSLNADGDILLLTTMPVEGELPDGTMAGKLKRIIEIDMELFETQDVWVGANDGDQVRQIFRQFDVALFDQAPPIVTGNFKMEGLNGYTKEGLAVFSQRDPAPLTLLAITQEVSLS